MHVQHREEAVIYSSRQHSSRVVVRSCTKYTIHRLFHSKELGAVHSTNPAEHSRTSDREEVDFNHL